MDNTVFTTQITERYERCAERSGFYSSVQELPLSFGGFSGVLTWGLSLSHLTFLRGLSKW